MNGKRSRVLGGEREPPVATHLRDELGEQIEKAIERAAGREGADLGSNDRVEQRGVEVTRDSVANVCRAIAQLKEEALPFPHVPADRPAESAHEIAGPVLWHIGICARSIGPEPAPRIVGIAAQDDGDVGGGGLGAEEPAELDSGYARHPEVCDHRRRRRTQCHIGSRGRVGRLLDGVTLGPKPPGDDLARGDHRIYENDASALASHRERNVPFFPGLRGRGSIERKNGAGALKVPRKRSFSEESEGRPIMEKVAIIGLGYVGLPVALAFARKFPGAVGFDIHQEKVEEFSAGP
jgi:UDP-glucose/GDP-mannose dehydrogenase family, NAD binding domain